jgi:hypothetical protein
MVPPDIEDRVRALLILVVAVTTAWLLQHHGWPWYAWLPAAILSAPLVTALHIILWYFRRKLTYEALARRTKADLRRGGDGWSAFEKPPKPR